ncbi:MAG: sensor histidine kinase [Flavobacteriaceae bacterium]
MTTSLLKAVFVILCSSLNCSLIFSQIIGSESENSYNRVFVDTDNFGLSYLAVLEDSYKEIEVDSVKFAMLNDLAYYWHTRNLITAKNFTQEGLALTAASNNNLWEGRFQITQGAILLRMEKLDSALVVLEAAKEKVSHSDMPFLYAQLGYVSERKGLLARAADYAMESLRMGEILNDKKAVALAYSDLSNLFWKQAKFRKGLEYGLKSLDLFEQRGVNDLDYDFTLYVVGNNHLALENYDEALKYFEHAKAIGERYGFYNNLSDIYISLTELYAILKDYKSAEEAGKNSLKYSELLDNNFMLMRSWLAIGKLQIFQGKYISAVKSLQKSINIATDDFGDEYYLNQAYENLGKAYAGSHDYKEAYLAFEEYDRLKNSIFTAEADQRISLLQTEFDVAEKESTIQIQENQLKKQQSRQTFISIIVALLLLILVLLYKTIQSNKKKNKLLQQQNEEKGFLLKEIHHRVKNNLEIVSSLLALQSEQITDGKVRDAMQKSQHRVHSMSMIHQKLYQGKSLSAIEMKDYFLNLSSYIVDTFDANDQVIVECEMDRLELDVDMAVPIGLIVNELLTNSLKYAFPNGESGSISISLREETGQLFLEVCDNGIGKPLSGTHEGTGFGTQLISLLTKQLEGKMSLTVKDGTSVSFKFQQHKAA